ncbi:PAS domain S-box-containing protein [Azospirillum lipoferum]|nr:MULTISPECIES: PAS domain-containing sensor histidine kinase [Azospirillum]MCP1608916.1 PAS domain S-box-containing protein [Azospirillum lipoferum]MDW5535769.1 PAS domain-containing protein [Azospirillum sp. NL1]
MTAAGQTMDVTGAPGQETGPAPASFAPLFDALPIPALMREADGRLRGNRRFLDRYGSIDAFPADLADAAPGAEREVTAPSISGDIRDLLVRIGGPPWIATMEDVTDQRHAARGLALATEKLEEAYHTAKLGYWEYGIHTGELVLSDAGLTVLGHDRDRFAGGFDALLGILHPDDRPRFGNMLESVVGNPQRVYVEYRVHDRDGRARYVSSSCAPRLDADGRLTHLFGVLMDSTERAEAAAQLEAAKQRLEEAYRTGHLGYWEYGIHSGALVWNREAFGIYGQDPDRFEPTFDNLLGILHPDDRMSFGNMLESVIGNSRRVYVEYRVIDPVGEVRYVSSSCAPRFDLDGRLTHLFGVMLDTTERARAADALRAAKDRVEQAYRELQSAQDSLVQTEKMASLGQLVAGVAHEVNGPVGVALTTASHLLSRAEDVKRQFAANALTRSALAGFLEVAQEAGQLLVGNTERIATLVHMFKQVAADQTGDERRTFYLREYTEDVLLSLHTQIGSSGHRVELACPEALQLESFPGAFARVLTHLVRNSLTHAFRPEQSGLIVIDIHADGDDWIEVVHEDDGQGILEADLPRIFDPFFTTARHAGCVGLGLHIAYNLATQTLGGQLSVRNSPGQGAVFILRVPRQAPDLG